MSTGTRPFETVAPNARSVSIVRSSSEGTLSSSEVNRRLLHMSPGLLPFLLWAIPHQDPWGPALVNVVVALFVAIVGLAVTRPQLFARPGERDFRPSVLGYALPIFAALSLCRGREEIGLMTLVVLAWGDGSATLGGMLLGGRPLPWNPSKTWAGTLCFVACATPIAALVYWGEARPTVEFGSALLIALGTCAVSAVVESVPLRMNDNLRVGATAAILGGVLTIFVVG